MVQLAYFGQTRYLLARYSFRTCNGIIGELLMHIVFKYNGQNFLIDPKIYDIMKLNGSMFKIYFGETGTHQSLGSYSTHILHATKEVPFGQKRKRGRPKLTPSVL